MGVLTSLIRSITAKVHGILTSKQNIRTSIIGKKVEVPESAKLEEMSGYIDQILINGIDTTDATATAADMRDGVTAYVNDEKITGEIPTRTSADLDVEGGTVKVPAGIYDADEEASVPTGSAQSECIDENGNPYVRTVFYPDTGKFGCFYNYGAGYYEKSGVMGEYQLDTVEGQTFVPGEEEQTIIPAGKFTTGDIKMGAVPKVNSISDNVPYFNTQLYDKNTLMIYSNRVTDAWNDNNVTDLSAFPNAFLLFVCFSTNLTNSLSYLSEGDLVSAAFYVRKADDNSLYSYRCMTGWKVGGTSLTSTTNPSSFKIEYTKDSTYTSIVEKPNSGVITITFDESYGFASFPNPSKINYVYDAEIFPVND